MVEDISMDLNIQVKEFEKQKRKAQNKFNENYSNDEKDSVYMFEDLEFESWEEEVKDGNILEISGSMLSNDKSIGWIKLRVPLDFDKLINIFQGYIKKLQKVKNVMETIKDE